MKYLLVLLVVVLGLWLLMRPRGGGHPSGPAPGRRPKSGKTRAPEMVACAHCDLRLPLAESVQDAEGRPYCGDAHRLAGPR